MAQHREPTKRVSDELASLSADVFDEWVETLPQEDREIARLHVYNLRAALNLGEKAAKFLVTILYLEVAKDIRTMYIPHGETR